MGGWCSGERVSYCTCESLSWQDTYCGALLSHLREHPTDAETHGAVVSRVYDEFQRSCHVGATRAPVPNDSAVWCDPASGLCAEKSCRQWWNTLHHGHKGVGTRQRVWVDNRVEYDALKETCALVTIAKRSTKELDEYQHSIYDEAAQRRSEDCHPRWVQHSAGDHVTRSPTEHGWREPLPEKPIRVSVSPGVASFFWAGCSDGLQRRPVRYRCSSTTFSGFF